MSLCPEIKELCAGDRIVLFVGSGVSATIDLPTWRGLIDHISRELEFDPELFVGANDSYPTLIEFYKIRMGGIGPLRSWMDTQWSVSDEVLRNSPAHSVISRMPVRLIYTTNYDRLLERSLQIAGRDVIKVANVKDIGSIRPEHTQVVKFHGDFDDDRSLVLTESDYFDRLSFDGPMDIKLRADTLYKPVLFIGYSLNDVNMSFLLAKLSKLWDSSGYGLHRPRSYLFASRPNPVQEAVLRQWGVKLMYGDNPDPKTGLFEFLDRLAS